jgi:hypothetical protein
MFGKIWENKITQNKNEIIYDYKIFLMIFVILENLSIL